MFLITLLLKRVRTRAPRRTERNHSSSTELEELSEIMIDNLDMGEELLGRIEEFADNLIDILNMSGSKGYIKELQITLTLTEHTICLFMHSIALYQID